ncbi:MAG: hypothetical protein LBD86_00760 [Spirochaetaceae bacterium]|jgi:hypothetical protein|nr:hypothetical protein [Spirochaetaceae bacterium]
MKNMECKHDGSHRAECGVTASSDNDPKYSVPDDHTGTVNSRTWGGGGYNLDRYRPVELHDLIRLGRDYDGGYVISKSQIEKTDILLSFGISDDWSFEADFEKRKRIKIYAYDYSVSKKCKKLEIRDNLGCMIGSFLVLRRSKVKEYWGKISGIRQGLNRLYGYFQEKHGRHFIPKYLGDSDSGEYISFDKIFRELPGAGKLSVFIKMDIEGDEYKALPHLTPYFDKINGMVIEFHGLNFPGKFEEITELLLNNYYVAHIHANNAGGHIIDSTLPMVLEITFMHKNMLSGSVRPSTAKYPLEGLDFPNIKTLDDVVLDFS